MLFLNLTDSKLPELRLIKALRRKGVKMNKLQAARNDIQRIMLDFQVGDLKKCG